MLLRKSCRQVRLPTSGELQDEARANSTVRYAIAEGDFNGDGVTDTAFLLKSTQFSGEALWVSLSQPGGGQKWRQLDNIRWPKQYTDVPLAMAIETHQPDVVAYACFDTASECNFGPDKDRPKIRFRDPSIVYFKLESAASLFFWSQRHQRFLHVWLSD